MATMSDVSDEALRAELARPWRERITEHADRAQARLKEIPPGTPYEDAISEAVEALDTIRFIARILQSASSEETASPPPETTPALPSSPDLLFELPIRAGDASHAMLAALANLTAAVVAAERVGMACARAIDAVSGEPVRS